LTRIRAFAAVSSTQASSAELALAIDMMRRAVGPHAELELIENGPDAVATVRDRITRAVADGAREYLLLIGDPTAVPSPGTLPTLIRFLEEHREVAAVLPSEPRDHGEAASYSTLYQFEQFASRLESAGAAALPYDGRKARMCLVRRRALEGLVIPADPLAVIGGIADGTRIVRQAYVHPFSDYYDHDRSECLPLVPEGVRTVLDIGCASGNFGALVKRARGCHVTGIEVRGDVAAEARERLDAVIVGDVLAVELAERFDCVTCLDTLEHLVEPQRLLTRVRRDFLRAGGHLVLSVPNVGHWCVIETLLAGRWDYLPAGHLCQTHLRFFTMSTIRALLEVSGFEIVKVSTVSMPPPPWLLAAIESLAASMKIDRESLSASGYHILAR
jgi:Methyltransferase domain